MSYFEQISIKRDITVVEIQFKAVAEVSAVLRTILSLDNIIIIQVVSMVTLWNICTSKKSMSHCWIIRGNGNKDD